MLKENQKALLRWNGRNTKRYISLGYNYTKQGDEFEVDVKDLTHASKAKVVVICDYCGKETIKAYQTYNAQHDDIMGDCCKDCQPIKAKHTYQVKYGVDNIAQSDYCKDKMKATCWEKYGTEYACQSEEVKKLIAIGWYKSGNIKTSQQQLCVAEMLNDMYGNCEINYPVGTCNLDCLVNVNGTYVNVEYDGWHWHKDKQDRDRRRDEFIKSQGIKVFRIKANRAIPTKEQILEKIDFLINENHRYTELVLDIDEHIV